MKIVINTCYGGFGLSAKATAALAALQDRPCYFFMKKSYVGDYVPTTLENLIEGANWSAFDIENPNELFPNNGFWNELTAEQRIESNKLYNEHSLYFNDIDRADPLLVQVVETLGAEANGLYSELKIVEIPDDVSYTIEEYDGMEWVAETHRTWS